MTDTPENPTLKQVPLLPLRDIIVFPHMVVPLFVGRERSIAALEQAMSGDKEIMLSAQRKAKTNNPQPGRSSTSARWLPSSSCCVCRTGR